MARFKYRAVKEDGGYVRGVIAAENEAALESALRNLNLDLVSYKIEKQSKAAFVRRLSDKDMITFFTHLEQLEVAGVPIIESLADIKDSSTSYRVKNLAQEIYETVRSGSLFSDALAKHTEIFDPVFVGLISTGEKTGNLATAFNSIIGHLKWSADIKRKTVKAIRYPLFSLCVMFAVLWVMTSIVVPKVTDFLTAQNVALPMITKTLIGFSSFIKHNTVTIVLLVPLMIIFYKLIYRIPKAGLIIDEVKLHIPIFGPILSKLDASRFCHFFAITFKSGIGILDCLEISKDVMRNQAMKRSIFLIKQQVSEGHSLAEAIQNSGHFSGLVVRMFKVGEESGNMENALENVRFFYDQEINDSIEKIVGMIQPTLTLVMGGMMAWITIAVFGPIYSTFSNL